MVPFYFILLIYTILSVSNSQSRDFERIRQHFHQDFFNYFNINFYSDLREIGQPEDPFRSLTTAFAAHQTQGNWTRGHKVTLESLYDYDLFEEQNFPSVTFLDVQNILESSYTSIIMDSLLARTGSRSQGRHILFLIMYSEKDGTNKSRDIGFDQLNAVHVMAKSLNFNNYIFTLEIGGNTKEVSYVVDGEKENSTAPDLFFGEVYAAGSTLQINEVQLREKVTMDFILEVIARRRNVYGAELKAVCMVNKMMKRVAEGHVKNDGKFVFTSGFAVKVLNLLTDGLNFRVKAVQTNWMGSIPDPWRNGERSRSKVASMGGMAQQVLSGEADISIYHSELLPERVLNLSFLQPHYDAKLIAVFMHPRANSLRNIFKDPFTWEAWSVILMTFFSLALSISLLHYLSKRAKNLITIKYPSSSSIFDHHFVREQHNDEDKEGDSKFVNENLMWAIAAITQQGWYIKCRSRSIRIAVMSGLLLSLILSVIYSATLISFLSSKKDPISTLSHIAKIPGVSMFVDSITYTTHSIAKKLIRRGLVQNIEQMNISEALSRIGNNNRIAFLTAADTFYQVGKVKNWNSQSLCHNISFIELKRSAPGGMFMRKNSPFKERLSVRMLEIRERGFLHRATRYYEDSLEPCKRNNKARPGLAGMTTSSSRKSSTTATLFNSLSLDDVISCFVLFSFGSFCSLLVLVGERISFKQQTVTQIKWDHCPEFLE